jgi:hypothetical protein
LPTTTPSIFSTILIWLRRFTNQIRCNNSTTIELENIVLVQLLRRPILSTITTKISRPQPPQHSNCFSLHPHRARACRRLSTISSSLINILILTRQTRRTSPSSRIHEIDIANPADVQRLIGEAGTKLIEKCCGGGC